MSVGCYLKIVSENNNNNDTNKLLTQVGLLNTWRLINANHFDVTLSTNKTEQRSINNIEEDRTVDILKGIIPFLGRYSLSFC